MMMLIVDDVRVLFLFAQNNIITNYIIVVVRIVRACLFLNMWRTYLFVQALSFL